MYAKLALYSYAAVVKEFYVGDFALSMGFSLGRSRRIVAGAVEGGFLRGSDPYSLTRAGLVALLGRLARYGGRWWLACDSPFEFFFVEEEPLWVAPYTRPLWREGRSKVGFAVVVRGLGDKWVERYASRRPFASLARLESRCSELLEKAGKGKFSTGFIAKSFFKLRGELRRVIQGEKLSVLMPDLRGEERGDLIEALWDLLSAVREARGELEGRLK